MYFFKEEDRELLVNEVTPEQIVDYLQLPTKRMGGYVSILCPLPDHNDTHFGSCMLRHGGRTCTCFVCHRNINSLQLLMYAGGLNFYEAMCVLADLSGNSERFEAGKRKKESKTSVRRLTREQKELLGLSNYSNIRVPVGYSDTRPEDANYYRDGEGFVLYRTEPSPWLEMAKDDPGTLDMIIQNKCKEKMVQIMEMEEALKNPLSSIQSCALYCILQDSNTTLREMLETLESMYREIEDIYVECGGKIRDREDIRCNIENIHKGYGKGVA